MQQHVPHARSKQQHDYAIEPEHQMYVLGFGTYAYVSHPHGRTETQQLSAFHMCRVPSCKARVYEMIPTPGLDTWMPIQSGDVSIDVIIPSAFKRCTSKSGEHQFDVPYVPVTRTTIKHVATLTVATPSTMTTSPELINEKHITAIINPNRKDRYEVTGPFSQIVKRLEAMCERGTITNWIVKK